MKRYLAAFALLLLSTPLAAATWLDVNYAGDANADHTMNVYTPSSGGPFLALILAHGGSFTSGSKGPGSNVVALANSRGIAVVSPNYRLAPGTVFPGQVHDLKAVVRYLRANSATYDLSTTRIVAGGVSAGGVLAVIQANTNGLAYYEGTIGAHTATSSDVNGAVSFSAASDVTTLAADDTAMGCPAGWGAAADAATATWLGCSQASCGSTWVAASAYQQMSASTSVPQWAFKGGADCFLSWRQMARVHEQLLVLGKASRLYLFPSVGHETPHVQDAAVWDDLAAWLAVNVP